MRATARGKPGVVSGVRITVIVAAVAGMWASALPAHADAISEKQAEATRIASALQQEGLQLERLAERANLARIRVDQVRGRLDTARAQAAALDQQLQAVTELVRTQAVESYVNSGREVSLVMNAGVVALGPRAVNEFIDRQAYASIIVAKEHGALQALSSLRQQAAQAERQLVDEQQHAEVSLRQMSADEQAAAAAAAAQRATLNQVKGELATLVRARQAELAAEQAARIRAQLAAEATARAAAGLGGHPAGTVGLPAAAPADPSAHGFDLALAYARAQLGKPYQWGAAGPGSFDCSGLTMMAWSAAGVALPHLAQAQYAITRRVALSDLKPGDLVFYGTPTDVHHVGLYVGDGNMIEAPQTGDVVKFSTIYWGDLLAGGRIAN